MTYDYAVNLIRTLPLSSAYEGWTAMERLSYYHLLKAEANHVRSAIERLDGIDQA